MQTTLRRLLLGPERRGHRRLVPPLLAVVLLVGTFAAYGTGLFAIQGGVVFVPGDAALAGLVAAVAVSYARGGLLAAWLVAYGSLLGYNAYHAFLGLSSRSLVEQTAYFLELDGLFVLAVEGVIVALLAFPLGWGCRRAAEGIRKRSEQSAVE